MRTCDWLRRLLLLALLAPCVFGLTRPAGATDKIRLSIGIDPSMAMYLVAERAGLFRKHGIEAEIISAESGGAALEMTVAGQTQGATTTELPGIRARSKGAPIQILAVVTTSGDWYGVVAAKGLSKAEDLTGRKVGVHKGTASEYYYSQFAAKQHLQADKTKVIYVASQEMIPALLRGDIDAFFTWEPWLKKGVETVPGARIMSRGGQVTGYDLLVFTYVTEKLARNRDLATRFVRSLIDTERFIKEQREEAVGIVAKGFRLDPKFTGELMGMLQFNVNLEQRWVDALRGAGRWMLGNRLIEREPDYDALIAPEPLTSVAAERVTYRPAR